MSSSKDRLSQVFILAARIFFALAIIFMPFRWRLELWRRPFFPIYSDYSDFLLFASDLSLLCMFVFWACSLLVSPRRLKTGSALIWISLVGLTIAGWVSVLGSVDAILSRYHAVRFISLFLFYLFIVNEIRSAKWVIVPAGAQITLQSFVAVLQSASQRSLGLQALGELPLDPVRLGTSVIFGDGFRFLRAYGLSDHPNILGGCIAFGCVLLLAVTLYGSGRQPALASSVFLLAFPALVMTFSRSAWLSLAVAGSFMVGCEAFARRWDSVRRAALLGALSLLVVVPFVVKNITLFESRVNPMNAAQDGPMNERAFLMQAGNTLFAEHSAIGVGLGASPMAMKKRFGDFPLDYQPPHYALLTAALEMGVVGGVFYFLLLIAPFVIVAMRWRDLISNPRVMGSFALLLAISMVGLFDYYTWTYAPGRLWQWLAWGLFSASWQAGVERYRNEVA